MFVLFCLSIFEAKLPEIKLMMMMMMMMMIMMMMIIIIIIIVNIDNINY